MNRMLLSSRLLIPTTIIGINILLWSGILIVRDGVIIQRDFNFPFFNENFIKQYYPIWNDIASNPNIENLPRLIIYLPFITMAALGVEVTIILKVLIIATFGFLTLSMYLLCSNVLKRSSITVNGYQWISLGSAFIFAYNPITLYFAQSISLLISLGALPLLLYFIVNKINSKYFPLFMTFALLISLAHPFNFLMNVSIGCLFLLVTNLHRKRYKLLLVKSGVTAVTFLLIFSWFLLPYIQNPLSSIELGREYVLSRPAYESVSDNDPLKIFFLERDMFTSVNTEPPIFLGSMVHYASLAALIIIALSGNLYRKATIGTRYLIITFSVGFLICTLLAMGDNGPFGQSYYDFISNSSVGWIFRSPLKFQMYQTFFIIPLFAISATLLKQKLKKHKINPLIGITIIFIFIGSSAYGIYDANVFTFMPINLPSEYFEINDLLNKQQGKGFRVIYYPLYDGSPTKWSLDHRILPFEAKSSQVQTYQISNNYNYVMEILYRYPFFNSTYYDLMAAIGVKYIIYHNDICMYYVLCIDEVNLQRLLRSEDVKPLYAKNDWYLFEILNRQVNAVYLADSLTLIDEDPQIAAIDVYSLDHRRINNNTTPIQYSREDPTTLRVHFNISSPSLLVLPETYDKGWKALINNQSIDSIKTFGAINGFPISKEGEYNVVIKYEPQKWFEVGGVIAIFTFISYIVLSTKGTILVTKARMFKSQIVTRHKINFGRKRNQ
jgi:hypothetical protein